MRDIYPNGQVWFSDRVRRQVALAAEEALEATVPVLDPQRAMEVRAHTVEVRVAGNAPGRLRACHGLAVYRLVGRVSVILLLFR